jgi:hypothetical protein
VAASRGFAFANAPGGTTKRRIKREAIEAENLPRKTEAENLHKKSPINVLQRGTDQKLSVHLVLPKKTNHPTNSFAAAPR